MTSLFWERQPAGTYSIDMDQPVDVYGCGSRGSDRNILEVSTGRRYPAAYAVRVGVFTLRFVCSERQWPTQELWYSANGSGSDQVDIAHLSTGVRFFSP